MPGVVIDICPPRIFDFSNVKALAGAAALSVKVAERIDVRRWTEGALLVRVHSFTLGDVDDSIDVAVSPEGFTYEDPTANFTASVVATQPLDRTLTTTPAFMLQALTVPYGAMVRVDVVANRISNTTATLNAKLSLGLVMKAAR